jgi:hypothetical protein
VNDLRDFYQFVGVKVNNGGGLLSPEQVLDEWRALRPDPGSLQEDTAALQEAIKDMENGDLGMPFEEFERAFRARHNLPKS